ncbi:hypothetical protein SAMN05216232_1968 [Virgibacillus subterraneus]|uniref:PhnB-like domain-containing protein n=1 Tax=Virgibacillus subterraneus TaxID=621109 RepID=A0A1H9EBJ9_9BACI|nr:hypothetical protein [Virgibacillus subterraneus]SEQ22967.1 hypothetical protein SAMN05216232_1968 [Virgibacillus subterraneus]
MKVFKMNDFDWVCAESEEQAKQWYHQETGVDMKDIDEDFEQWGEVSLADKMYIPIDDLPEEEKMSTQLDMKNFYGELCAAKTFDWVIKHENITKPCVISSTEI